ncbi:MAG: hypothetical protein ABWZ99_07615, partial [Ilumatobacteraceae bacterium]
DRTTPSLPSGWARWGAIAAVLAAVGLGASLSDPGRAQPATSPIEIVSTLAAGGGPLTPDNVAPKISDDGSIVVFDSAVPADPGSPSSAPTSTPAAPTSVVTIRDRATDTTTSAPDTPSLHPGVSGDGCVVAYSVPVAATGEVRLTALDLCAPTGGSLVGSAVVVDTVDAAEALPAPALSADGSVIVWSTGRGITRYVAGGGGYAAAPITVPTAAFGSSAVVTGTTVDTSADGSVVTFVAGPGTVDYEPAPANVFLWSDSDGPGPVAPTVELASTTQTGSPGASPSTSPSVSADGQLVVFESSSTDLAATGAAAATAPFVVLLDREANAKVLADDAARPAISADGTVVVYDSSTDVHLVRWVGGAGAFESVTERSLSIGVDTVTSAGPSVSGPVVSGDGALAVFDSANGPALTTEARVATGGHVWARATVDAPPTTTTTTTTVGSTTTPTTTAASRPTTTVPAPTLPVYPYPTNPTYQTPRPTLPPSRPSSGSSSNSGSSRPSIGSGSTSTYYSTGPVEVVAFVPGGIEFSPTIVAAGRQSAVVSLSNPTTKPVTVTDVSIEGSVDGAFTIPEAACVGVQIPPDGVCEVVVSYAPVTVGSETARIVALLSDGNEAYGDLAGSGAPAPIVTVVPGVASSGQVVAIQGSGFPGSITVELAWLDGDPVTIDVDETGSFVETLIVLPHTSRGPASAVVAGQTDLFATVTGQVLITDTSDRSSSVLTQSAGSPFAS